MNLLMNNNFHMMKFDDASRFYATEKFQSFSGLGLIIFVIRILKWQKYNNEPRRKYFKTF